MTISALLNLPVTLHRRSSDDDTIDDYGDPVPVYDDEQTVGELQQSQSRRLGEPEDQGEFSDTFWVLFLPAGTALGTGDRVTAQGQKFEVVGDAWEARNPRTQQASHTEATLRRAGA